MSPTDMARQVDYDELVKALGGAPSDRSGPATVEIHEKIVRILDGKEPDPRFLPIG